jgi:hypothetical protein
MDKNKLHAQATLIQLALTLASHHRMATRTTDDGRIEVVDLDPGIYDSDPDKPTFAGSYEDCLRWIANGGQG